MSDQEPDEANDLSDWEVEEGIPQTKDPFLQKYFDGREALIEQELSQRSDASFRQSLSPIALEASGIVSRILEEERSTVWTKKLTTNVNRASDIYMYPGMSSLSAIEGSNTRSQHYYSDFFARCLIFPISAGLNPPSCSYKQAPVLEVWRESWTTAQKFS